MKRLYLSILLLFMAPSILAQQGGIGGGISTSYASRIRPTTVAGAGTPSDNSVRYFTDGTQGTFPCTGGGTGSYAFRIGGAWACPTINSVPATSFPLFVPAGTTAAPTIALSTDHTTGWHFTSTAFVWGSGGANNDLICAQGCATVSGGAYSWSSSATNASAAADTVLSRAAAGFVGATTGFRTADGGVSPAAYGFIAEPTLGLFRRNAGQLGVTAATTVGWFDSSGWHGTGTVVQMINAIGAVSADGVILTTNGAAVLGGQEWSPRLRFTGQGWRTNATAESEAVDWIAEVQPVQGTANPSSNLVFSSQINAGGYTPRVTFNSGGGVTIPGGVVGNADTATAATTATTATNATNIAVTDDMITNATMFPLWVTTASGNQAAKVTSTFLMFNPTIGLSIGGTAPTTKLTVFETSSSSPRGIQSVQNSTDTNGARVGFAKSRGTAGTPTTVVTGDTLGRLMFRGHDGSNYLEMASIEAQATGTIAATRVPTKLVFATATDAAPSVLTAALTLDKDQSAAFASTVQITGNVGLGTTPSATSGTFLVALAPANTTGKIQVQSTDAAGASASAAFVVTADTAGMTIAAEGTGRTGVSRWGATVGGWNEILGTGGNGVAIGTITAAPLKLGTNSVNTLQIDTSQNVSLPILAITAGTMTGTFEAVLADVTTCRSWTNAQVAALPTTAGDIAWGTLPAKTKVVDAAIIITGQAAGPTTVTVALGRVSAAFIDYIVASDAKAAVNTVYGDVSGERGTNLTGYDLPSYTGTTVVNAHFISTGANLSTVTGSTGLVCVTTRKLP